MKSYSSLHLLKGKECSISLQSAIDESGAIRNNIDFYK